MSDKSKRGKHTRPQNLATKSDLDRLVYRINVRGRALSPADQREFARISKGLEDLRTGKLGVSISSLRAGTLEADNLQLRERLDSVLREKNSLETQLREANRALQLLITQRASLTSDVAREVLDAIKDSLS